MATESKRGFIQSASEFVPQVRQEMRRVVWPTRKETILTTLFVFIFAVIASIYFVLVDQVVFRVIRLILGLGG